MQMETSDRQQRRSLQKEYGSLYRAVSDILFRHDIMDLDGKRNTGDYDLEVDLLLLGIGEAEDREAVQGMLHQIFMNAFGAENCGGRERYDGAAAEIWRAYERYRNGTSSSRRRDADGSQNAEVKR